MKTTRAISVRAPWWWAILYIGKRIENRDWPTGFRGTVYLQASKWWRADEVQNDIDDILSICRRTGEFPDSFSDDDIRQGAGCIVGKMDIVDCVKQSTSPWFFGEYGFVLDNVAALETPVPCKGALGLFTVPDSVLAMLESAKWKSL